MKKFFLIFLGIVMFQGALSAQGADKDIQAMVDYFERLQKELKIAKTDEMRQKILKNARKRALSMIDAELIGELSLGELYQKLSEDQQEEYIDAFRSLFAHHIVETHIPTDKLVQEPVKVQVISRIKRYDPYFYQQAEVVKVIVTKGKSIYRVSFYMLKYWSGYKIYDIPLDGASLLTDYRHQFQGIIMQKGVDYLLEKMNERLEQFHENGN